QSSRCGTVRTDDPDVLVAVVEEPALIRLVSRAGIHADAVFLVAGVLRIADDECERPPIRRPRKVGAVVAEARELPRLASGEVEDEDVTRRPLSPLRDVAAIRRERQSLPVGRPLWCRILRCPGGDLRRRFCAVRRDEPDRSLVAITLRVRGL